MQTRTVGAIVRPEKTERPLYEIANEIQKDWKKPYFGCVPYLEAMHNINKITDPFGMDSAKDVVRYFLANANTWRGEVAKRIKLELNTMLKDN